MAQQHSLVTPISSQRIRASSRNFQLSRILRGILIATVITIILSILELIALALLNPYHIAATSLLDKSISTTLLLLHNLFSLVIPLLELLGALLLVQVVTRSMALRAYCREVQEAQEHYCQRYTTFTSPTSIFELQVAHYQTPSALSATSYQAGQQSFSDMLLAQDTHLLVLGVAGAGKTTGLRAHVYKMTGRRQEILRGQRRIPLYIPLKDYGLFLKANQLLSPDETDSERTGSTLLDFLSTSDLAGLRHLRPYIRRFIALGRIHFLCDGLDEVESEYQESVVSEILQLVLGTANLLVLTCREVQYHRQQELDTLVNNGLASLVELVPLRDGQVREFVEQSMRPGTRALQQTTAGRVMQFIEQSRLRSICSTPQLLSACIELVRSLGLQRARQIDTRGKLLRTYVTYLIDQERQQAVWNRNAPAASDILRFLGQLAFVACYAGERNALQLPIERVALHSVDDHNRGHLATVAEALLQWLAEHPVWSEEETAKEDLPDSLVDVFEHSALIQLLEFSLNASLIDITPHGVVSFRHALIAEYLVAEYLSSQPAHTFMFYEIVRTDVVRWSEAVTLWAGLVDSPETMAEQFLLSVGTDVSRVGTDVSSPQADVLPSLVLSLICMGVTWNPPQISGQRTVQLLGAVRETIVAVLQDKVTRQDLAQLFTLCADECGPEIYQSLFSLLYLEGIEGLLTLLDTSVVPDLLFNYLRDTADIPEYDREVKRLVRVLGGLGAIAIPRAAELSQPAPGRGLRLRAAAINVLGGTNEPIAVETLISRLSDTEQVIADRAVNALLRLGPQISLEPVLQELKNPMPSPFTHQIHQSALLILERFLYEQNRQATPAQQQSIIETLSFILTSNYAAEADIQQQAREILARHGDQEAETEEIDERKEQVAHSLIQNLSSHDEMLVHNTIQTLQQMGKGVTPLLLNQLGSQSTGLVRVHILEVFQQVRDQRALPDILSLVADTSPEVQQYAAQTLRIYAPESIPGLIQLVLNDRDDAVAERANQILFTIGESVAKPVAQALTTIVPGRTRLLVQLLEMLGAPQAIPALIKLIQTPGIELLLLVAVIRALSKLPDERVIQPLIDVLANNNPQIYEEAIDALGQLGEMALPGLIAALDVSQDTVITSRVRRALLVMVPFPGEQLVEVLQRCSTAQEKQIRSIFLMQGAEAAYVLVKHLFHPVERVRSFVRQTLKEMTGAIAVPALLEALVMSDWLDVLTGYLQALPEAIAPLVNLLSDPDRADAASSILPQYRAEVLEPLIAGLDDQRGIVQERARNVLVTVVRQQPQTITRVVQLFGASLPPFAHENLLVLLTGELADLSVSPLLEGLADAYLIDDVAETLVRLLRKREQQQAVLRGLLAALRIEERRRGAETALIKAGAQVVSPVGDLITDEDQAVARSAQLILCEIGVPAFPLIWAAHSDTANPERREAALNIFRSIRTEVIKDELVNLLKSDVPEDIAMALALLLERVQEEFKQPFVEREMIPALLHYVQTHGAEQASLRIIALLLVLGGNIVIDHLLEVLSGEPEHHSQLLHAFLLLGGEAEKALHDVFNDLETPQFLRAEVAGVLGMLAPYNDIVDAARSLSSYGISLNRTRPLDSDQLSVALRSLGGLLAGGHWDTTRLQELFRASKEDSSDLDLYGVLLGMRYSPIIQALESELATEKEKHKQEVMVLAARIITEQQHAQVIEHELEQIRYEHGIRGDELEQTTREADTANRKLDQALREKQNLSDLVARANQQVGDLRKQNEEFRTQLNQTIEEKHALQEQLSLLRRQLNP